jgi:hypothetical protein
VGNRHPANTHLAVAANSCFVSHPKASGRSSCGPGGYIRQ